MLRNYLLSASGQKRMIWRHHETFSILRIFIWFVLFLLMHTRERYFLVGYSAQEWVQMRENCVCAQKRPENWNKPHSHWFLVERFECALKINRFEYDQFLFWRVLGLPLFVGIAVDLYAISAVFSLFRLFTRKKKQTNITNGCYNLFNRDQAKMICV